MKQNWSELFKDEWERVKHLGASYHDPEEKRVFWEAIKAKKLADPNYRVEQDFPLDHMPAIEAPPANESMAKRKCREILEMFRRKGYYGKKREGA